MTQRLIGKSWWVDLTYQSRRYRLRSPENSKKGAQAYEQTLRRRLAEGTPIQGDTRLKEQRQSFEKFAWFWFRTHVEVHNKPSSVAKARGELRHKLIPFFGAKTIDSISTLDVERYKAKRSRKGLANKTINNELSILGKCLRDAKKWYGLKEIPEIALLKTPPSRYNYLDEAGAAKLLEQLDGLWFEIVYVALATGLRRGELQGLCWDDLDLRNRTLIVRFNWCAVTRTLLSPKGNRTRTIPLTAGVVNLLEKRQQNDGFVFTTTGRAFDAHYVGCELARASKAAGLPRVTLHVLRHSFASQLAMKGVPIAVIQQLLGHTDIKVTMRYAHLSQSVLIDAVNTLERPIGQQLAA
ncbi:MAG: tyrosine-type recombinase/integrase [Pseudomonadota bacterium]